MARDYTDEIYNPKKVLNSDFFVSSAKYESTMFIDVLVVMQQTKVADFTN